MTKLIKTSNFNLAVLLMLKDGELAKVDRTEPRRLVFCFNSSRELEKVASDFLLAKDFQVSFGRFVDVQKKLKALIHDKS